MIFSFEDFSKAGLLEYPDYTPDGSVAVPWRIQRLREVFSISAGSANEEGENRGDQPWPRDFP
jgi:hypothetical protein